MALQWNPANKVVIGCDLRENDLRKVGRSTGSLAVDARDFGGDLCPLGGVQAAFDGSDAVGRHGGFLSNGYCSYFHTTIQTSSGAIASSLIAVIAFSSCSSVRSFTPPECSNLGRHQKRTDLQVRGLAHLLDGLTSMQTEVIGQRAAATLRGQSCDWWRRSGVFR